MSCQIENPNDAACQTTVNMDEAYVTSVYSIVSKKLKRMSYLKLVMILC